MSQPPPTTTDPPSSYTDPTFSLLNASCLDLLLIELVPMAYRITNDLAAREEEFLHGTSSSTKQNRLSANSNDASSTVAGGTSRGEGGPVGGTAGGGVAATVDEEEAREAVFHRLESLGYRVGLGVVERYAQVYPFSLFTCARDCLWLNFEHGLKSMIDSRATPLAQLPPSTSSSSSAKTYGHSSSASKSTTSRRTIVVFMFSRTTHLSH